MRHVFASAALCGLLIVLAGCNTSRSTSPGTSAVTTANVINATWTKVATLDSSLVAGSAKIGWTGPGFNFDPVLREVHIMGGIVNDPSNPVGEDVSSKAAKFNLNGASSPLGGMVVPNVLENSGATLLRTAQALYAIQPSLAWPPSPAPVGAMLRLGQNGWVKLSASAHEQGYYFVYNGRMYRLLAGHGYISRFELERQASLDVFNESTDTWDVITTQDLDAIPHRGLGTVVGDTFVILGGGYYLSQAQVNENRRVVSIDLPATLAMSKPMVTLGATHPDGISGDVLFAGNGRIFLLRDDAQPSGYRVHVYDLADNSFTRQSGADAPFVVDSYFRVSDDGQPHNGVTYFYDADKHEVWEFKP